MPSPWQKILQSLGLASTPLASRPPNAKTTFSTRGYPATFEQPFADPSAHREKLFDPALKQYREGYRLGEPRFADAEIERRWRDARCRVMDHILRAVVASPHKDNLVLRGSLVLKAWLGDAAREPGDMDWVVTPKSIRITDTSAAEMFSGIIAAVLETSVAPEIDIIIDGIATDEIWTYDRAPGRRIVFPWCCADMPGSALSGPLSGVVQFDAVFGEELLMTTKTAIPAVDGSTIDVQTATPQLSLAWKLMWLRYDAYPQGKDLYDATLL